MAGDDSEDEWRFSVDEFDDGPEDDGTYDENSSFERSGPHDDREDTDVDEEEEASVAGEFAPEMPVVPEMPQVENAAFVVLGVILTILALGSAIGGASFGLVDALVVVLVVGGLGALAYGVLVRLTPET